MKNVVAKKKEIVNKNTLGRALNIFGSISRFFFEFSFVVASYWWFPLWIALSLSTWFIVWQASGFFIIGNINKQIEKSKAEKAEDKKS